MQIVPGKFIRVPNKPPYQHPAASPVAVVHRRAIT